MITRRKALYVFLSSLLGMLLLLMFHRSTFVIYEIIGDFYPAQVWLNLPYEYVVMADFFTMLLAMFIGGWYGVWLGLNWYTIVYEDKAVTRWFHGFIPHNWRDSNPKNQRAESQEQTLAKSIGSVPKRIVVTPRMESFETFRSRRPDTSWNFDDVAETPVPKVAKKAPAKKRVAKKRVAKKTTKSKTVPAETE